MSEGPTTPILQNPSPVALQTRVLTERVIQVNGQAMVPVAMSISGYVLEADALKLQQSMLNVAQNAADAQAPKAEPDDDAEMTDEELSGLRPVNEVPEVANALNKKNPT